MSLASLSREPSKATSVTVTEAEVSGDIAIRLPSLILCDHASGRSMVRIGSPLSGMCTVAACADAANSAAMTAAAANSGCRIGFSSSESRGMTGTILPSMAMLQQTLRGRPADDGDGFYHAVRGGGLRVAHAIDGDVVDARDMSGVDLNQIQPHIGVHALGA